MYVEPGFRKMSAVLAVAGYFGLVNNIVTLARSSPSLYVVTATLASGAVALLNTWLASVRTPMRWMLVTQAAMISIIGIVSAVLNETTSFGGLVLFALSIPLLAKRGAFRHPRDMITCLGVGIAVDAGLSWILHSESMVRTVAKTGVASAVVAIIYFAFQQEVNRLVVENTRSNRVMRDATERLRDAQLARARALTEVAAARQRLRDAEQRLDEQAHSQQPEEPIPIELHRLSTREVEVVKCLVQSRGRNRDIASELGIRERTVKAHLYHICNKIGVDSRLELFELFRAYFG